MGDVGTWWGNTFAHGLNTRPERQAREAKDLAGKQEQEQKTRLDKAQAELDQQKVDQAAAVAAGITEASAQAEFIQAKKKKRLASSSVSNFKGGTILTGPQGTVTDATQTSGQKTLLGT